MGKATPGTCRYVQQCVNYKSDKRGECVGARDIANILNRWTDRNGNRHVRWETCNGARFLMTTEPL